ncbi:MAG: ribonuclease H-like domain-containing protein [Candidatus Buchananbacteria bacterium]
MSKEIVFDIETRDIFSAEKKNPSDLRLSVVVIYRYETNTYEHFFESELAKLWPLLEHSERLIGYNINHFDLPVLQNSYSGQLSRLPALDLFEEVQKAAGFRLKLESLAQATLGYGKSGSGLDAVKYFAEGKLKELVKYCTDDVKVTKELYEYGLKNKEVFYQDFFSKNKIKVPVDFTTKDLKSSVNLSLPF